MAKAFVRLLHCLTTIAGRKSLHSHTGSAKNFLHRVELMASLTSSKVMAEPAACHNKAQPAWFDVILRFIGLGVCCEVHGEFL